MELFHIFGFSCVSNFLASIKSLLLCEKWPYYCLRVWLLLSGVNQWGRIFPTWINSSPEVVIVLCVWWRQDRNLRYALMPQIACGKFAFGWMCACWVKSWGWGEERRYSKSDTIPSLAYPCLLSSNFNGLLCWIIFGQNCFLIDGSYLNYLQFISIWFFANCRDIGGRE
jgi:hypothetical protein